MSVLIFVDQSEGQVKKGSLEALTYGVALAKQLGTTADAVVLGNLAKSAADLSSFGVAKVYHGESDTFNTLDSGAYTDAIMEAAQKSNAEVIIFSHNQTGRAVAPRIAARLKAGLVPGAVAYPIPAMVLWCVNQFFGKSICQRSYHFTRKSNNCHSKQFSYFRRKQRRNRTGGKTGCYCCKC